MMDMRFLLQVPAFDWFATLWFILMWAGYTWFAEYSRWANRGLLVAGHHHRLEWARQMLLRELRVSDAALVGNLMNSVSFYARTTLYIIAGLLAVLGALDQVISLATDLSVMGSSTRAQWEVRLILLLIVFVVAYFKFAWSLRQFNMLSILIGSCPIKPENPENAERIAQKIGGMNSMAGDEFNRGIRAYYFGLATLAWFVQTWLFILVTTLVVAVLFRRDFASRTLKLMRAD